MSTNIRNHGQATTRLYHIWTGMKQRCGNTKHKSYINYGGRGIIICKQWTRSFIKFAEWARKNGYDDTLTIERIDNDGNYCPKNCTWIPKSEQSKNTRYCRKYKGETMAEASRRLGGRNSLVILRLKMGWSMEKAFTTLSNRHI